MVWRIHTTSSLASKFSDTPRRVPECKNSRSATSSISGHGLFTDDYSGDERVVQNPSRGDHGYASSVVPLSNSFENLKQLLKERPISPGVEDDVKILHVKMVVSEGIFKRKISGPCVVKVLDHCRTAQAGGSLGIYRQGIPRTSEMAFSAEKPN